jgi:hypothetical protein
MGRWLQLGVRIRRKHCANKLVFAPFAMLRHGLLQPQAPRRRRLLDVYELCRVIRELAPAFPHS